MADHVARLTVQVQANIADLQRELRQLQMTATLTKSVLLDSFSADIVSGLASGFSTLGKSILTSGQNIEATRVSFAKLAGSVERGNQLLNDLNKFATQTPFDIKGTQEAARQILAFGYNVEEVIPMLRRLGDAAASVGKTGAEGAGIVQRLALQFGQMKAQGVAYAGNLRFIAATGIPVYEILSKKLTELEGHAVSVGDVFQRATKRQLDSATVTNALFEAIEKNYGGMMEKLNTDTLKGIFENLSEAVELFSMTLGETAINSLYMKEVARALTDEVAGFTQKLTEGQGIIEAFQNQFPILSTIIMTVATVAIPMLAIAITNTLMGALSSLPALILSCATSIETFSLTLYSLSTTIIPEMKAALSILGNSITGLVGMINPWVLALAALAATIYLVKEKSDECSTALKEASDVYRQSAESAKGYTTAIAEAHDKLAKATSSTTSEQKELADAMDSVYSSVTGTTNVTSEYNNTLNNITDTSKDVSVKTDDMKDSLDDAKKSLKDVKEQGNLTERQLDDLSRAEDDLEDYFKNGQITLSEYIKRLSALAAAARDAANAMGKFWKAKDGREYSASDDTSDVWDTGTSWRDDVFGPDTGTGLGPDTGDTNDDKPNTKPVSIPKGGRSSSSRSKSVDTEKNAQAELQKKINAELQKTDQLNLQIFNSTASVSSRYTDQISALSTITGTLAGYYKTALEGEAALEAAQNNTTSARIEHADKIKTLNEEMTNAQLLQDEKLKQATTDRINKEIELENINYQNKLAHILETVSQKQAEAVAAQQGLKDTGAIEQEMFNKQLEYQNQKMASMQEYQQAYAEYLANIAEAEAANNAEKLAQEEEEWSLKQERWEIEQQQKDEAHAAEMERLNELSEAQEMYAQLGQQAIQNTINGLATSILQGKSLKDVFQSVWKTALTGVIQYYAKKLAEDLIVTKQESANQKKRMAEWVATGKAQAQAAAAAIIAANPLIGMSAASSIVAGHMKAASAAVVPFAKGGMVTGPTYSLIGEGRDDEFVTPINNRTMSILANAITDKMSGNSTGNINMEVNTGDINTKVEYEDFLDDIWSTVYNAVSTRTV